MEINQKKARGIDRRRKGIGKELEITQSGVEWKLYGKEAEGKRAGHEKELELVGKDMEIQWKYQKHKDKKGHWKQGKQMERVWKGHAKDMDRERTGKELGRHHTFEITQKLCGEEMQWKRNGTGYRL